MYMVFSFISFPWKTELMLFVIIHKFSEINFIWLIKTVLDFKTSYSFFHFHNIFACDKSFPFKCRKKMFMPGLRSLLTRGGKRKLQSKIHYLQRIMSALKARTSIVACHILKNSRRSHTESAADGAIIIYLVWNVMVQRAQKRFLVLRNWRRKRLKFATWIVKRIQKRNRKGKSCWKLYWFAVSKLHFLCKANILSAQSFYR